MIKTCALEKVAKFLKKKKVTEFEFELKDGTGFFNAYRAGIIYDLVIRHDNSNVKATTKRTEYL